MQFLSLDSTAAVQVFDACMHSLAKAYTGRNRGRRGRGRCASKRNISPPVSHCILFRTAKPIHHYWWQKWGQICVTADFQAARFISGFALLMIKLFCHVMWVITAVWTHQSREEKSKARWWNSFVLSSSMTYYYSLWEFTLIHVLNSHLSPTKKSTRSSWNVNDDGNKWIAKTVPCGLFGYLKQGDQVE